MKVTNCSSVKGAFNNTIIDCLDALRGIKDGKWKNNIDRYRSILTKEEKEKLPSIMWSGEFENRTDKSLLKHSGIICIDIDKVENLENEKKEINNNPYTFASWVSPSGDGLKVLVRTNATVATHRDVYLGVMNEYASADLDSCCINEARHCFVSYDPDLYLNENSEVYNYVYKPKDNTKKPVIIPETDKGKTFNILLKWFNEKHNGIYSGKGRNNNTFKFAISCNDYGIEKTVCTDYLYRYIEPDFPESEITKAVNSAYKNHQAFGIKTFEDINLVNKIKKEIVSGKNKKDIIELNNINDDVFNEIKNESINFWDFNEKGNVIVSAYKFKTFLQDAGYFLYNSAADNIFIKITNKVANPVTPTEIKKYILTHLENNDAIKVWDYIANTLKFFDKKYLDFLDFIEIGGYKNNENITRFYFKNCAVDVTKDRVTKIDYVDVTEVIWETSVLKYNYSDNVKKLKSDYDKFILDVCGGDSIKYKSFCSVIGYLICGYNNRNNSKAIILNDQNKSKFANGGTGKGIFVQGIELLKPNKVMIDLSTKKLDRNNLWNEVNYDTEIVQFEEVPNNFNMKLLYTVITEGINIEKKNKDTVSIPFDKTPKIIMQTNNSINTSDGSTERRVHELELSNTFSHAYTPFHKYGENVLEYNTDEQYASYLEFMFGCLRFFKINGLVKDVHIELSEKKMINSTNEEFWIFFQDYDFDYNNFLSIDNIKNFGNELNDQSGLGQYYRTKDSSIPIHILKKWLETTWKFYNIDYNYGKRQFNGKREWGYTFSDPDLANTIQKTIIKQQL